MKFGYQKEEQKREEQKEEKYKGGEEADSNY